MIRRGLVAGVWLLLSVTGGAAETTCREDRVSLRGAWGQAHFRVEIADDETERARGLMMRESLPRGAGMLFIFDRTRPVSFWMENTLIPLDMLFIDEAGAVVRIHHEAIPGDRTQIPSRAPVRYVLEINGGMADALGITVGSEMRHASISESNAVWPCSR
ncbi:DUF192 domain-containing protein [Shimia aestuarii]|uniref:DUF192 domain-containing protein n=1 Tax=Shimia aestuarii TaxID=254406 RepID=UPI001FB375EE|nr:DUF192 domain-containing protein [Shimia aestuarii]